MSKIRWLRRFRPDYYKAYVHQLEQEISNIEPLNPTLSDEQLAALDLAREEIESAKMELDVGRSLVLFWTYVNAARAQRPLYYPDIYFPGLVRYERERDKGVLDEEERRKYDSLLTEIFDELEPVAPEVTTFQRQCIHEYLDKIGRKWNSFNVRIDARYKALVQLTLITLLLFIAAILLFLFLPATTNPILLAAGWGALGGIVSAATTIRDIRVEFRSWSLDIQYFLRPVIGSVVAVVLILALTSGISPIVIAGWTAGSSESNTAIAVVSFGAGLSERLVLGKLYLLSSES